MVVVAAVVVVGSSVVVVILVVVISVAFAREVAISVVLVVAKAAVEICASI